MNKMMMGMMTVRVMNMMPVTMTMTMMTMFFFVKPNLVVVVKQINIKLLFGQVAKLCHSIKHCVSFIDNLHCLR